MTDKQTFSQIETVESEGLIYASVFDVFSWLMEMYKDESMEQEHREAFYYVAQQLTRLVTK